MFNIKSYLAGTLGILISIVAMQYSHAEEPTRYNQRFFDTRLKAKMENRFGRTDTRQAWIKHDWTVLDHDSNGQTHAWGNVIRTIAEHHLKDWAKSNALAQEVNRRRKISLGAKSTTSANKNNLRFKLEIGNTIASTLQRGKLRCGMQYNPWSSTLKMEVRQNITRRGASVAIQHNTKSFRDSTSLLALNIPF